jgi:hypothetical protein
MGTSLMYINVFWNPSIVIVLLFLNFDDIVVSIRKKEKICTAFIEGYVCENRHSPPLKAPFKVQNRYPNKRHDACTNTYT